MKHVLSNFNHDIFKIVPTQLNELIQNEVLILFRNWGEVNQEQLIFDDIQTLLSQVEMNEEVTLPFDYQDSLTLLENKIKNSIQMFNQNLYHLNKDGVIYGYEMLIFVKKKNEIAIGFSGNFQILVEDKNNDNKSIFLLGKNKYTINQNGLPDQLLGINSTPEILTLSINCKKINLFEQIVILSDFNDSAYSKCIIDV